MAEAVEGFQPYGYISHAVDSVAVAGMMHQRIEQVAGFGLGAFAPFLFDTSLHQCGFDQFEVAVLVFAWVLQHLLPPTAHPHRHTLFCSSQDIQEATMSS